MKCRTSVAFGTFVSTEAGPSQRMLGTAPRFGGRGTEFKLSKEKQQ